MRYSTVKAERWCWAILIAISFSGSLAWAETGKAEADRHCEQAERAERDARDVELKSEERLRFLKGGAGAPSKVASPPDAGTASLRQSSKARIAQAREILPKLRQAAEASSHDSSTVPGFSRYFSQMESNISRVLQAIDACLDAPGSCNIPSISCPPIPPIPTFRNVGDAQFVRNVQQSYAQAANQMRQACLNLNGEVQDIERIKRESQASASRGGLSDSDTSKPFGETDLLLRRAESLKQEALHHRQEADRISGVGGYCRTSNHASIRADVVRSIIGGLKTRGKMELQLEAGLGEHAKVIDLKSAWERKWNQGKSLNPSDVPLPILVTTDDGVATIDSSEKVPADDSPSWWERQKVEYRKSDEQLQLTEFLLSRPKEMAVTVFKEGVKKILGGAGATMIEGYEIMSAVKETADEVGEILVAAPKAIASGNAALAQELILRTERVPLNLMNNLFEDPTGLIPPPRYKYEYKSASDND